MINNNVLEEYFIWDEKNSTDHNQNLTKKEEIVNENSIIETKNDLTQKDWKDITDPKLRKKMWCKAYYKVNKDRIKLQKKSYRDSNKDKIREQRRISYKKNKNKIKLYHKSWYQSNKNKVKSKVKLYTKLNKQKINNYTKTWRKNNKDKTKSKIKEWFIKNKDKVKAYRKNYINDRLKNDLQFKLSKSLRTRLYQSITRNFKSGSAVRDLGCTIEEFKKYLESKFQPGMTWDNWTKYGWHIDHIKPLSLFDLTDRDQLLEACHYTNLQPLWAKDNLSKSNNYPTDNVTHL